MEPSDSICIHLLATALAYGIQLNDYVGFVLVATIKASEAYWHLEAWCTHSPESCESARPVDFVVKKPPTFYTVTFSAQRYFTPYDGTWWYRAG